MTNPFYEILNEQFKGAKFIRRGITPDPNEGKTYVVQLIFENDGVIKVDVKYEKSREEKCYPLSELGWDYGELASRTKEGELATAVSNAPSS